MIGSARRICRMALCLSLLAALPAALAAAEPTSDEPTPTDKSADTPASQPHTVLEALGSDDYMTRQRAMWRLLREEDLEQARIAALYAAAETPEQRHRLLTVARHHAIRRMRSRAFDEADDRGAVGMTHRRQAVSPGSVPGLDHPAIEVIEPMPGFPAYAYLQRGDLIVGLDGEPLPADDPMAHFKRLLQTRQPGQRIRMTIYRDGEQLEHAFRLASYEALNLVYNAATPEMMLRSPFREQWQTTRADLLAKGPAPRPLRITSSSDPSADDDNAAP